MNVVEAVAAVVATRDMVVTVTMIAVMCLGDGGGVGGEESLAGHILVGGRLAHGPPSLGERLEAAPPQCVRNVCVIFKSASNLSEISQHAR
jgi:hypothetical protein